MSRCAAIHVFCSPGCNEKDHDLHKAVLALELNMQKSRLEPITRKSPMHVSNGQDTSVSMPSAHWRGIFSELPAVATPVHHLFSPPAACRTEQHTPSTAKEQKPGTPPHPSRPASCPSSLCSSQPTASENLSYTAFRNSLAVVTADLKLPRLHQTSQAPPGEHYSQDVARCMHFQPETTDSNGTSQGSPTSKRTWHGEVPSRRSATVGVHCCPVTLASKSCVDHSYPCMLP